VLEAVFGEEFPRDVVIPGHHPQRLLLAPGHAAQALQRVRRGKLGGVGHAEGQVAGAEAEGIVEDDEVCGGGGEGEG
jgi:hypothetical protein